MVSNLRESIEFSLISSVFKFISISLTLLLALRSLLTTRTRHVCILVPSISPFASLCLPNHILLCVNLHLYVFLLSHYKDSSNSRKKPLETGHRCSSSSSLPVIHDPPVFLLGPQLYPPQPQFLPPDVLLPSVSGEPHRPPGNSPKI